MLNVGPFPKITKRARSRAHTYTLHTRVWQDSDTHWLWQADSEHIDMAELEIKANKYLKQLTLEIKQDIKNKVKTTDANDKLKERFDIQAILTELDKYKPNISKSKKSKKSQTPQAIEDKEYLYQLYTKLNKILDKSK